MNKQFNTDLMPLQQFLFRAKTHPEEIYLNQPENRNWTAYSWGDVERQARIIAAGLIEQGFQAGDKIE